MISPSAQGKYSRLVYFRSSEIILDDLIFIVEFLPVCSGGGLCLDFRASFASGNIGVIKMGEDNCAYGMIDFNKISEYMSNYPGFL